MPLFKLQNNILEPIKEKQFKLEKEIQVLTEKNMKTIFGIEFISSEFSLNNFRVDSLAFDKESNSFIIIEYKRDKSFSVIDQGYAYLSLMLNNKADFILEYNEKSNNVLKKDDVDWSQSRVMFVSPSFTTYQKEAINFKDLPIELWEITQFDNNSIAYNQIKTSNTKESIKTISQTNNFTSQVNKEVKVYTEDESLQTSSDEIKELYEKYKIAILNLDDNIEIKPRKFYIAFVASFNIVDIQIQKNSLKMWINLKKGLLDDSKNITKDVSNIGHLGNGDYELQIKSDDNFEYILSLIRQSLEKSK